MSQAIANFSLFSPNVIGKNQKCAIPVFSKPIHGGGRFSYGKNRIKAMAGDARDNLDHLQRAAKLQQQQQQQAQPRKRAAPAPPIGLWDRFPTARTVQQMMETMERMMEDPLAYSGGYTTPLPREAGVYGRGRTPWEIKEGESDYKMRFDMPGMTKEDVKVWVEDKKLVVKAEKAAKKTENGAVVGENGEEWSAKSYGRYSSRIALPENIQFEEIKAEVKDGVLYITIPRFWTSMLVELSDGHFLCSILILVYEFWGCIKRIL